MQTGHVVNKVAGRAFAFIRDERNTDYFFLRKLNPKFFDQMITGDAVRFTSENTPKGLRIVTIEPA